jgi:hypothetical protein
MSIDREVRRRGLALVAVGLAFICLAIAASTASAKSFRIGYADSEFLSESEAARTTWNQRAAESGGSVDRFNVPWAGIAPPKLKAGFDATDPSSPGYNWQRLDAAVRSAASQGMEVLLTVQNAPRWAEGPEPPTGSKVGIYEIPTGAWKPDPVAYGEFAHALAERYDGSFPDPLHPGSSLPRVRYFDAWNEPNLVSFLAPQEEGGKLVGPAMYRKLLNHFYAGVKEVQPSATVLGASSAPFGAPDGAITPPVLFLRSLLCLKGDALRPVSCPEKAHLDKLSAHPIQVGPPTQPAISDLDATTPDLGRLTAVVRAAEKAKTVLSSGPIGLWVTEFWVNSSPPDPGGIPVRKQARWYEQDMYEYWKAGAEAAIELQVRDQAIGTRTGVYFRGGGPKPSHTAMRFPLVGHRAGSKVGVWGIAPEAGSVAIQAFQGGGWKTVAKVRAGGPSHPFTTNFTLIGAAKLRAVIGGEKSLPWALGQ